MSDNNITNQTEMKVLKRQSKSFEALQQCAVLTILMNHGFGFIFKKPERRSTKTVQSLLITKIILPNKKVIDYEAEIDELCREMAEAELKKIGYGQLNADNIESIAAINKVITHGYNIEKLKTVKRHKEANKNSLAFNQLLKYLHSLGYHCSTRSSKPASFTQKMIKITGISNVDENGLSKPNKIDIHQEEIEYIGMKMNEYIYNKFIEEENELTIEGNQQYAATLLFTHVSLNGSVLKSFCGTQRGRSVIEIKEDVTSKINPKANGTVKDHIEDMNNEENEYEMEMVEDENEEQEMAEIQEQINDIVLDNPVGKTTQNGGEMTIKVEESLYDMNDYQQRDPNTMSTVSQMTNGSNVETSQLMESQKEKEEDMEMDETYKAIKEYYSHFEEQTDGFLSWGGGYY